jgi:hypothetical protein
MKKESFPDPEKIPVLEETKRLFEELARQLLNPNKNEFGSDRFSLADGRGVDVFVEAKFEGMEEIEGLESKPYEGIASVDVYREREDGGLDRTAYTLLDNGDFEKISGKLEDDSEGIDSITGVAHPDSLIKFADEEEARKKAAREMGVSQMTESEAQEAIKILEELIKEKEGR